MHNMLAIFLVGKIHSRFMIEMHFCSAKVRTSLIVWLSTNHKNFKNFWKHSNQVSFRSVCIVYIIKQNILLQFKNNSDGGHNNERVKFLQTGFVSNGTRGKID